MSEAVKRVGELPPIYRHQHDPIVESTRSVTDENGKVTGYVKGARVITTCVLDRLKARKLISHEYWRSGRRLQSDFHTAGLTPQVTLRFKDYISGSSNPVFSDRQLEAKQAFDRAMRYVGPELNDLLFDVVCADKTVRECEAMRAWRPTVGLAVLQIALRRLDEHYETT